MGYLVRMFFVILISNTVGAQISFFNYYSDNGVDRGEGIVQLEDSSYVVTGSSSSFSSGSSQAFLMKIDSLGNFLWSNQYGGTGSESGRRVLYKKDFGFFVCGFTNSFGSGGFDNYLAKVDESGALEWEKAIGGSGWEKVHDAALARDTGVVMVGESSSNTTNSKDIYIVRTDIIGDTLWTKRFGGSGDDYASDILPIDDSTFIIVGRSYVEDSSLTKVWASKIGDDGTLYWKKTYGVTQNSWANGIENRGGQFVIIGGSEGLGCIGVDSYNCIITEAGDFWGEYVAHINGDNEFVSVANFASSSEVYVAESFENDLSFDIGRDIYIDRITSATFGFIENFVIGRVDEDVSNQIIRTNDGSAIAVGYSTNAVSGGNDIYVCKIGPGNDYPNTVTDVVNQNLVTIIEDESGISGLKVFPNPSSGLLTISSDFGIINDVKVTSMTGELLATSSNNSSLDLVNLENGCYILLLKIDNHLVSRKIVIQH
ncbi:MAG: T9SS type A sorting domain-containing protein [Flavobacteriales bacterium]|nr:T9SS type A sorting domain-containing protein [Flavobacteriales bacterium]